MLIVQFQSGFTAERKYIFDVLLKDFLGIDYVIDEMPLSENAVIINDGGNTLKLADCFFAQGEDSFYKYRSLPKQHLDVVVLDIVKELACLVTEKTIPVIYGEKLGDGEYIKVADREIQIGIDVFGSAFFMLSRYEEVVKNARDQYDRFSAKESLAYQEGFLERPIINEYIEILWWAIKKLWPDLKRKKRTFRIIPTHDVDRPYGTAFLNSYEKMRSLAGDLIKRRNISLFWRRLKMIANIAIKGYEFDEDNTFDFIMDISERNGLISNFYFMTLNGVSDFDGNYDIERYELTNLIKKIAFRGHEIGIHPSFVSYDNENVFLRCVESLKNTLTNMGLHFDILGGRQHYLRWKCPETWCLYEKAGLTYDTTLAFADHIGFRCGVCYEYPVFDVVARKALGVYERPLIVMEGSGLDKSYMGLTKEEMLCRCLKLKETCRKYQGDFVILWHNSSLATQEDKLLYQNIIEM